MAIYRQFANQFSVSNLSTTSTNQSNSTGTLTSIQAIDFGFQAGLMKLIVNSAGPAYIQLNGQVATTNDYQLSTGDTLTDWYDIGAGLSGISIAATSTAMSARLGAWG